MKRLFLLLAFALSLTAHAQLFYDSFTRSTDPGPLTPWTAQSGAWSVTGGTMQSGLNTLSSYANATITNVFVNYTVQGRFKFPAGAFGGGLAGRLNPTTGTHYAAWIYPENSPGGSNVLRLLKFQNYTTFGYLGTPFNAVASTNLAAVGTGFHTVRMDFSTNRIIVYLDGVAQLNAQDTESTYYTNGAVGLDMWTDAAAYNLIVDDVVANGLGLSANNDTNIIAATGVTKSVPAPGVLANDTGGTAPLSAVLVAATTRGTLSLSNNGGFTYIATNGFAGNDTFTYRATDGTSTSGTATVTITVTPDNPPVANNDSYSVLVNSSLSVPAPGVLANDTDVDGNSLTAILVAGPANGTLTFSNNGSFLYVPNSGFLGVDTFTYRANDGQSNSAPATVTISVQTPALFSDNFTRGTDPGPLAPWLVQSGNWTVTGGVMKGGTNALTTYGFAYITNSYSNYSVQARIQFPTGAFGGGLGGRLNPGTGAHYAAWIYPENSTGGSNVLRLIKFQSYSTFSYLGVGGPIAQVNLPAVGTNFHTVKLAFLWNQIAVYFDGALMITAPDQEVTPYLNGSVVLDMWTDTSGYQMSVDDVIVNPLAVDDNYAMAAGGTLSIPAPGVLANDTEMFGTNLAPSVVSPAVHGTLTFTNNGGFTYTPTNGFSGVETVIYRADDGVTNIGTASVNINVIKVNNPPSLPSQTNHTINEFSTLIVTNTGSDPESPPEVLSYRLLRPPTPTNVVIDANGIITWTPISGQGPNTNTITTVVTDDGIPPLSATNSFAVVVNHINLAPVLPAQPDRTINQFSTMTVNNTAIDSNKPPTVLTYTLLVAPTNASISGSGVITWTPIGGQAPSTNAFSTVVSNFNAQAVNEQRLSATNTFTVVVNDINVPPILPPQPNRTIAPLSTLVVTNAATDTNVPPASLTYGLINPPLGVAIDTNGVITWTPTPDQDQTTNVIRTVVTNFNPFAVNAQHLTATNSFTVVVNGRAVVLVDSTALVAEGCYPTNNAVDPGETVTLLFSLKDIGLGNTTNLVATLVPSSSVVAPSGPQSYGVISSGGGIASQPFTFTASGACGSTITANLQLQDGSLNMGTTSVSLVLGPVITVLTQNFDSVTAPALPAGWTTTNAGAQPIWFTTNTVADTPPNAAFSADAANVGINELDSPPITLPNGPAQLSFRNNYSFETDTLRATNGFDGGVLEIQIGANGWNDITNAGGSFVANGYNRKIDSRFGNPLTNRWAWSGTNGGYATTIVNLPAAAWGQTIQLRWRAGTDTSNPGGGWRIDTVSITAYVCCARVPPVLPVQADRTNAGLATLIVTNTASDPSVPPNSLTYTLLAPPSGAQIDTNGIITWTPVPAQVPSTNIFTTVVTDNGTPSLSATNSFTVFVQPIHHGPALPPQNDRTVDELVTLVVTNTATDMDIPVLQLSYQLLNPPGGAVVDTNGVITWTPSEAQGPGTNTIITVVTDSGQPALSATNSFTVVVNEINSPPSLPAQMDRTITGLTTLVVTNTAIDLDIPANTLTYSLLVAPTNAAIDPNGVITWTPVLGQVPSTNVITTVVTDYNPWAVNQQHLSATNSFTVFVRAIHNGPTLPAQPDRTIAELTQLVVTNTAADTDVPVLQLSYQLLNPPAGAVVDTNGVITWTPSEAQGPGTNIITTVVTDSGQPPLSTTNSFTVVVNEINSPPSLPAQMDRTITGLTTLVVTNTGTDSDIPADTLTYSLLVAPTNAIIDPNGVITWTPTVAQVPSTNIFATVVTDYNPWAVNQQHLSATNSFTVFVRAIHNGPTLPAQPDRTIAEMTQLVVTNTATDSDIPTNQLFYSLLNPPAGADISTNGVITWTPTHAQAPSTNIFETVVNDNGVPPLSATNSFTVFVTASQVVPAPTIESIVVANGVATISWTSVTGHTYRLLYTGDLDTNWVPIPPDILATNSSTTATDSTESVTMRFYRVQLLP